MLVHGVELVRDEARERQVAEVATGAEQIVDLRAADRFAGAVPDVWPGRRAGHIPGSLNLPFPELVDPDRHTLLPPERLAARLAALRRRSNRDL